MLIFYLNGRQNRENGETKIQVLQNISCDAISFKVLWASQRSRLNGGYQTHLCSRVNLESFCCSREGGGGGEGVLLGTPALTVWAFLLYSPSRFVSLFSQFQGCMLQMANKIMCCVKHLFY